MTFNLFFLSQKKNPEDLEDEEVKEEGPYDWIMHLQKQRGNVWVYNKV